jgi:hypothetical protein
MVNDLRVNSSDTKMWKFVDDVSSSENLTSNSFSVTQSTLDPIDPWASNNCMKLNAKKCKEFRFAFLKKPRSYHLWQLMVTCYTVQSHKVLGLIIQNNLKWDEQIRSIVTKASKRLYGLRVLCRRGGARPSCWSYQHIFRAYSFYFGILLWGVELRDTPLSVWRTGKSAKACHARALSFPAKI